MDRIDGQPVYSATDLVAYLACEHLTQLERAALAGLVKRPMRDDPGARHHPPARLPARGALPGRPASRRPASSSRSSRTARSADRGDAAPRGRGDATIEAMAVGRRRHLPGDVLRRHVPRPRRLPPAGRRRRTARRVWGPYHYEVADTKLARHVKASAVLQICSYVDQLERIQGVRPEWLHVALGGSARAVETAAGRRLHGLLPERPRPVPRDAGRRDAAGLPAGEHLPGAGRALRRLPLGGRMRHPSPRRRSPEPRRRASPAGSGGR